MAYMLAKGTRIDMTNTEIRIRPQMADISGVGLEDRVRLALEEQVCCLREASQSQMFD